MDIGKPRRTYRVEPLREPVPAKRMPAKEPPPRVKPEREKVPAR